MTSSSYFQRALISISLSTLLCSPLTQRFLSAQNRLEYAWEPRDGVVIIVLILLVSASLFAVNEVVCRCKFSKRFGGVLFAWISIAAISALIYGIQASYAPWSAQTQRLVIACTAVGLGILSGLASFKETLNRIYRNIAILFSPLFGILAIQLLTFPTLKPPLETYSAAKKSRAAFPIFVLVFDEWSYRRTFEGKQIRPHLTHLRSFAENAVSFHKAFSPYAFTSRSVPGLIYQTEIPILFDGVQYQHTYENGLVNPSHNESSLFSLAKDYEYNTASVGFYIHTRLLVGDALDYASVASISLKSETLLGTLQIFFMKGLDVAAEKFAKVIRPYAPFWVSRPCEVLTPYRSRLGRYTHEFNRRISSDIFKILRKNEGNIFIFGHYCLPHFPAVYESDGSYRVPLLGGEKEEVGYERNLEALDHAFGALIEGLKEEERYENALIIVTSDHSWRGEPSPVGDDREMELRHVPLFVKMPHQSAGREINSPVRTAKLRPLIEAALQQDISNIEAALQALSDES